MEWKTGAAGYQEMLCRAEQVLDDVERALALLDDGAYGRCEVCAAPIADTALEATPTVRWCDRHLPLDARS